MRVDVVRMRETMSLRMVLYQKMKLRRNLRVKMKVNQNMIVRLNLKVRKNMTNLKRESVMKKMMAVHILS